MFKFGNSHGTACIFVKVVWPLPFQLPGRSGSKFVSPFEPEGIVRIANRSRERGFRGFAQQFVVFPNKRTCDKGGCPPNQIAAPGFRIDVGTVSDPIVRRSQISSVGARAAFIRQVALQEAGVPFWDRPKCRRTMALEQWHERSRQRSGSTGRIEFAFSLSELARVDRINSSVRQRPPYACGHERLIHTLSIVHGAHRAIGKSKLLGILRRVCSRFANESRRLANLNNARTTESSKSNLQAEVQHGAWLKTGCRGLLEEKCRLLNCFQRIIIATPFNYFRCYNR